MSALHAPLMDELHDATRRVIAGGAFILGSEVADFEAEFAADCGARHAIGVGSGLDALTLALTAFKTLGRLRDGDKVVVPANTFIATVLSVTQAGLEPILVEPNETSFNLDVAGVQSAAAHRPRAVIAVHLYGQLAPMIALADYCRDQGLLLLEDAAQAHGASLAGRRAGSLADAAAFSFYPTKNLGALGDAGAVVTDEDRIADIVRKLRNYGGTEKYRHELPGMNSRLDEIQAAILRVKLRRLDEGNERRRAIALRYRREIRNPQIALPAVVEGDDSHVWHLFVVRSARRDELARFLASHGVQTQIHYPTPPHKQACFQASLGHLSLPLTERIHREVLSLPLHPGLSDEQVGMVVAAVNAWS